MIVLNVEDKRMSFIEWVKLFDKNACLKNYYYWANKNLKHIQENITEKQKRRICEIHGWDYPLNINQLKK